MSGQRRKQKEDIDLSWVSFGWDIFNSVGKALDYWCWEIAGDPLDCYSIHQDKDLYELAEEFSDWEYSGITEKDLKKLRKMPKKYYDNFNKLMKEKIEEVVNKLREEYGGEYGEGW